MCLFFAIWLVDLFLPSCSFWKRTRSRARVRGWRSCVVKVDFEFPLIKSEVQVALYLWRVTQCGPRIFATCHLWKCRHRVHWNLWYSLSILEVTFLKINPFRFMKLLFRSISNTNGTRRNGAQPGTLLREMLIEATFNQTNFWFIFSQSCDIQSEFSYIICSYLRRLVIQNSLKYMGSLQICIDPLPNPIGILFLILRSIYRTVYMPTDLCQRLYLCS